MSVIPFFYKAETTYNVPIENAVSLILDVDHTVKWVPYMGSIKVLSRDDKKAISPCIWCWIFHFL